MPSDPAKPQTGDPLPERISESTAPKATAALAPPVESVVPPSGPVREGPNLAKPKHGQQSNPLPPAIGSCIKAGSESTPPDAQPHDARNPASESHTPELKSRIALQLPSGVVVVDVKRDYLRDFGVLVPGVASIVVTVVIAILANQINQKQTESLAAQSKAAQVQSQAAQDEVSVKFIEEFQKHLSDLTLPDVKENLTKKTLSAIALAQYGEKALPVLKVSLSAEDDEIREGATVVIVQMLSQVELRDAVISNLQKYFAENNPLLRVGVLDCFVTMNRNLTDTEFHEVRAAIGKYVDPHADYSDKPQERKVLQWATKFLSNWPRRDSRDFLLGVIQNSTSGKDAFEDAINYLPKVTMCAEESSDPQNEVSRQEVLTAVKKISPAVYELLGTNITDAITKLEKREEVHCGQP